VKRKDDTEKEKRARQRGQGDDICALPIAQSITTNNEKKMSTEKWGKFMSIGERGLTEAGARTESIYRFFFKSNKTADFKGCGSSESIRNARVRLMRVCSWNGGLTASAPLSCDQQFNAGSD